MDDKEALHTAARRYCMERESEIWREIEAKVAREQHRRLTAIFQALQTSCGLDARREMIQSILRRIEGLTPDTFASLESLRAFLLDTGKVASLEEDTCPLKEETGIRAGRKRLSAAGMRAEADEQARFGAYVEALSPQELLHVQPLPHHRLLSKREVEDVWRELARRWQLPRESYWWPLGPQEIPPPHVLAFNVEDFDEHVPLSLLRDWLLGTGDRTILRFDNDSPGEDYEMDLDLFALDGLETYWTSPKMDWVIYVSHESSITIGGEWLLNLVMHAWPAWADHLRTTHMPPGLV